MGQFLSGVLGTDSQIGVGPQQGLVNQDFGGLNQQAMHNFNGVQNNQDALAMQLQAQAAGQGPNPALMQLHQTMQQNAGQAAGLYANQRGINAGLAARNVGNMQANANQQAAGQAATLSAQQQIAAQHQLGGLYGQQANQNLGLYGINQGAQAAQNQAANQANNINAGVAAGNQQQSGAIVGGILGGAGAALGAAHGGMIPAMAGGGLVADPALNPFSAAAESMQSGQSNQPPITSGLTQLGGGLGKLFKGKPGAAGDTPAIPMGAGPGLQQLWSHPPGMGGGFAGPSAAGIGISPVGGTEAAWGAAGLAKGGPVSKVGMHLSNMKSGGNVPGQAMMPGDSSSNDTVPAMLSPKEIVLPRSITMGKDAPDKAKAFVQAILARQSMRKAK